MLCVRTKTQNTQIQFSFLFHSFSLSISRNILWLYDCMAYTDARTRTLLSFLTLSVSCHIRRYKGFLKDCPNGLLTEQVSTTSRQNSVRCARVMSISIAKDTHNKFNTIKLPNGFTSFTYRSVNG